MAGGGGARRGGRLRTRAALAALCALAAGCAGIGPASIEAQRGSYSDVIGETDKAELLANIIRLKFNDPPVLLRVRSVTAAPGLEATLGFEAIVGTGGFPDRALASPELVYRDQPTIVYDPVLGREFAAQMLVPISAPTVFLMYDNGFDFDIVSRLIIAATNGVSNARDAPPAERARFVEGTAAMGRLLRGGMIRIGTVGGGRGLRGTVLEATVAPGTFDTPDGRLAAEIFGLDRSRSVFGLTAGLLRRSDAIAVRNRSLLSILSLLSNYVEVPESERAKTWPVDFTGEADPLLRIRASRERPADADPGVYAHGWWWYVAADDVVSRNVLYLTHLLFSLQSEAAPAEAPVQLTLPVR